MVSCVACVISHLYYENRHETKKFILFFKKIELSIAYGDLLLAAFYSIDVMHS